MITVLVPVVYTVVLFGSLATFSYLYRRRKAVQNAQVKPWFENHLARDIYLSLLHTEISAPVPVLHAALLRRAMVDVDRIVTLRQARQALQGLLQRGQVGDDLWTQFLTAEKDMEAEVMEVVQEANGFKTDWGKTIFQSASEMAQNEKTRKRAAQVGIEARRERAWWDQKRQQITEDFEKSL